MRPVDVLLAYQKADTPIKQDNVIRAAWKADNEEFFEGLALSLDPNWKIPVSSVPEIQDDDETYLGTFTPVEFQRLTRLLPRLNAEEAREAINEAAMDANVIEWNHWYRRILLKNLSNTVDIKRLEKLLTKLTT